MKWVTMWGNAQSFVLPNPAVYAKDLTLRYPLFVPFAGNKIRITLDNFCGNEEVRIQEVNVSVGTGFSDEITEPHDVTFSGERSVVIPAYGSIQSDELEIELFGGAILVVSMYLKEYTNMTSGVDISGPLSKGYFAYGYQARQRVLDMNTSKSTSWVYFLANVDLYASDSNEAVICYGDSITSQAWPDYLLLALRENGIKHISVIRKAVSGTRVLREYNCITYQSYGKSGRNRFWHEVSSVSGGKFLIIQQGINDIIHPVGTEINPFRPMSDLPSVEELIMGLTYYLEEAKRLKLKTYLGTLLPIYGWRTYAPFRENLKNEVNAWIRCQNHMDFEAELGTLEEKAYRFKAGNDSGDHLHPSAEGYRKMGAFAAKKLMDSIK